MVVNDESAQTPPEVNLPKPTADWDTDDAPKMPTKVRDLFVWTSLSHQKRTYPKEFFTTLAAIATLLSIIFAFFQEWFAILVTWAALFLFYAVSKLEPEKTQHKITTQGIVSLNQTFLWGELGVFWFTERNGDDFLHVATRNIFGQVMIIINKEDKDEIRDILAHYLPYVEVWEKSTTEKISDWFSTKFPIQKPINTKIGVKQMDEPKTQPIVNEENKKEVEVQENPAHLQQKFADKPMPVQEEQIKSPEQVMNQEPIPNKKEDSLPTL